MITIKTTYLGDLRTWNIHLQSGCELVTDAPTDNRGKGESFSPTDLLATMLASCMLTIMGIMARQFKFSIDGATAEVTKVMGTEPRRVNEVIIDFCFPAGLTEKDKKCIQVAVDNCPVGKSLHPDLKQTIHLNYA